MIYHMINNIFWNPHVGFLANSFDPDKPADLDLQSGDKNSTRPLVITSEI